MLSFGSQCLFTRRIMPSRRPFAHPFPVGDECLWNQYPVFDFCLHSVSNLAFRFGGRDKESNFSRQPKRGELTRWFRCQIWGLIEWRWGSLHARHRKRRKWTIRRDADRQQRKKDAEPQWFRAKLRAMKRFLFILRHPTKVNTFFFPLASSRPSLALAVFASFLNPGYFGCGARLRKGA